MEAIYSSKLYKGSKRKPEIRAALNDPLNQELVVQLREYLNEPELDKKVEVSPTPETATSGGGGSFGGSSGGEFSSGGADFEESVPPDDVDVDTDVSIPEELADDAEDVAESSDAAGRSISASTSIPPDWVLPADEIQGLLNAKAETAGVSRIRQLNREAWIHYGDRYNLNDVMNNVIFALNASGYTMLEFNRLARTENAIVFEISEVAGYIEPISEVSDE